MIVRAWMSRPWAGDAAVAAVVLAAELLGYPYAGLDAKVVLIAVAAAGLMVVRRRHPLVVAGLVGVLYLVGIQPPTYDAPVSAMLIALYAAGRHSSPPVSIVTAALAVAGGLVVLHPSLALAPFATALTLALTPASPVAAGYAMRLRAELSQRREQQAAENAVREERRRIARELHDVIAHHVSVVGLYMGVARRTIPADPDRARSALRTGEETARQAMTEMRRLLDVLRTDGEPIENQAGVGVARLPALVEASGSATLEVQGQTVDLPTTVDHALYRIAQEALTNTRKHAAGARSRVRLAYLPDLVELEINDDGRSRPGTVGLGFGLAGMAERVSLCGGEIRAGPSPEGGFTVHARIPLPETM
ncbi:sensor histidine kinase [Nonomuraea mesophila]|uniref:histidine kinase n=1 Tax=Nonomuraea mesophila TaxID=2530382 RepID=A0A4R5E543_9ACTN|nr:histidine kinase [Nonomuraea mesophila]TDE24940.1 sensor histidine kinase [Nonomuraea mesophila]